MNKKTVLYSLLGVALAWGGWLIYRNNRNKKIDETPISYEEALKNIEEVKE
jgi:predicted negative regulator of RcsB-dependent stress response